MIRRHIRILAPFTALLLGFMALLLIRAPMPLERQRELCVINIQVAPNVRLLLNCDSAEFMRLGYAPSGLMEVGNARQSRPLFVAGAYALSWVFKPVAALLQPLVPTDGGPNPRGAGKVEFGLQNMLATYLAYLTINVACVLASWLVLVRLTAPGSVRAAGFAVICAGTILFANDVSKAFLWSPHTQMLNILVPMVACIIIARPPAMRMGLAIAAVAGVAMLIYANAMILFGALLIALFKRPAKTPIHNIGMVVAYALLFAVPTLGWGALVRLLVGSYYVIEAQKYDEFVWVLNAAMAGPATFVTAVWTMSWFFIRHALLYTIPPLIFVLFAAAHAARHGRAAFDKWWAGLRPLLAAPLLASGLSLGFFIFVGFQSPRLAYPAIPPLVALAAIALVQAKRVGGGWTGADRIILAALAIANAGYIVVKDGPWS
ncbi:hypothetical protein [Sphingomonas crocodyli]|uniref:Glycosyltransferase RgtA/B/C/D-like domain-containing protein n=1 Tax=Sphingomonas crocodyli TaxID=1979270 RepID=A0A437M4D5_9SPHN|nr:hypothetical protein [Sphingomonas crocodyli]RVT92580.1 hypothetical protein EOD43_01245 [Sphingomonas crocodyli]